MLGVGKPYGPAPLFIGRDMRVIDNKALLLRLRNKQQVTQVIPKSKALPDNKVVVNWGIDETHVLKNLGINAPSPIEGRYK